MFSVRVRKVVLWKLADDVAAYAAEVKGKDGQYDENNDLWKVVVRLRDMADSTAQPR